MEAKAKWSTLTTNWPRVCRRGHVVCVACFTKIEPGPFSQTPCPFSSQDEGNCCECSGGSCDCWNPCRAFSELHEQLHQHGLLRPTPDPSPAPSSLSSATTASVKSEVLVPKVEAIEDEAMELEATDQEVIEAI